jgi:hypothetical protein
VACPSGRLVITSFPLLSTLILADPYGQSHTRRSLGIAHSQRARTACVECRYSSLNSLYQGEAPEPFAKTC